MKVYELSEELGTQVWFLSEFAPDIVSPNDPDAELSDEDVNTIRVCWILYQSPE